MYPQSRAAVEQHKARPLYAPDPQELSNDGYIAELPAETKPIELESPIDPKPNSVHYPVGYTSHEQYTAVEYDVLQGMSCAETSRPLWSPDTEKYPNSVPGSIEHPPFHKPLPISPPKTPDADVSSSSQSWPGAELQKVTALSRGMNSPPQGHWAELNMAGMDVNYPSQHDQISPMTVVSTESRFFSARRSLPGPSEFLNDSYGDHESTSYCNGVQMYNTNNNAPLMIQRFAGDSPPRPYRVASIRLGNYSFDEIYGWQHHPGYEQEASNAQTDNHSMNKTTPSTSFEELGNYQYPDVDEYLEPKEEADMESLSCNQCSKLFRGKYVKLSPIFFTSVFALTMCSDTAEVI
jgi:hypothetical protein